MDNRFKEIADMNQTYDIVIPMAFQETMFLKKSLPYIIKHLIGAKNIFLITSLHNQKYLRPLVTKYNNCVLLDEDNLIPELSFSEINSILKRRYPQRLMRPGWYFQQFIKLGFSLSKYCTGPYLTWDADTIPLRDLTIYNNGHPQFTLKKEYNKPYFDTIKKILGVDKVISESFIAEHMLFIPEIVKDMLFEIKKKGESTWIESIIQATDYSTAKRPEMFSEFETYGTYCTIHYPELYQFRHLHTFRKAGLINGRFVNEKIIDALSFDMDTASFELIDSPQFPMSIIHKIYVKILKIRSKYKI